MVDPGTSGPSGKLQEPSATSVAAECSEKQPARAAPASAAANPSVARARQAVRRERRFRENRLQKRSIGFGAHVADPDKRRVGELLEKSEPEDLLKFGLIPEFVGRLPVIATLRDLDVAALVTILTEPKNALIKQYQKLFELEDVALTFTPDALLTVAEKALARKTGARGLRSIVEGILLDTMFDLPDMDGVNEIVVDKDVVEGRKDPVQVLKGKEAA